MVRYLAELSSLKFNFYDPCGKRVMEFWTACPPPRATNVQSHETTSEDRPERPAIEVLFEILNHFAIPSRRCVNYVELQETILVPRRMKLGFRICFSQTNVCLGRTYFTGSHIATARCDSI